MTSLDLRALSFSMRALDRPMQLPLTLAGGVRTTFADVVSFPLPDRLTALTRYYSPIVTNAQGKSANGASALPLLRRQPGSRHIGRGKRAAGGISQHHARLA
jgi:hypothetical protein